MKTIKKIVSSVATLLTTAMIISGSTLSASAASHSTWISRGAKNVSYCKTTFSWSTDSRYLINSSSAWQDTSGIFAEGGGTYKISGNGIEETWSAITKEIVGFSFKGFPIGYSARWEDYVTIYNGGGCTVEWNV